MTQTRGGTTGADTDPRWCLRGTEGRSDQDVWPTGIVGPGKRLGGELRPNGRHKVLYCPPLILEIISKMIFHVGLKFSLDVQATWQPEMRWIKARGRLHIYLVDHGPPDPNQLHVTN